MDITKYKMDTYLLILALFHKTFVNTKINIH